MMSLKKYVPMLVIPLLWTASGAGVSAFDESEQSPEYWEGRVRRNIETCLFYTGGSRANCLRTAWRRCNEKLRREHCREIFEGEGIGPDDLEFQDR